VTLQSAFAESSKRWAAGTRSFVLRLAILRDFYRQLHGLRTQCLSEDQSGNMQLVESWMERVRLLRSSNNLPDLDDNLAAILSPNQKISSIPGKPQLTPLSGSLRSSLERNDRDWERAIAAKAIEEGWSFWSVDAKIELHSAEKWHQNFVESLWPGGISLFVEQIAPSDAQGWYGRWTMVIKPGLDPRTEFKSKTFLPSDWKHLFPEDF